MNMDFTNKIRTACEVIRELNDVLYDERISKPVKKKLKTKVNEIYSMVKRMNKKLNEYKKAYDAKWYEDNQNYGDSLSKRSYRKVIEKANKKSE